MIFRSYNLKSLLKTARYLIQVEDRIPPGFFVDDRPIFRTVIDFYRTLLRWQNQGYKGVEIAVPPDPPANVNQPFVRYYLWIWRLSNLIAIQPTMTEVDERLDLKWLK